MKKINSSSWWRNKKNFPILNGLKGPLNGHWKGGYFVRKDGYHLVIDLEKNGKTRYRLLHRVIMEKKIGRPLLRNEIIHHKNGNPSDNRICNLEILSSQSNHASIHSHLRTRNKKGQYV